MLQEFSNKLLRQLEDELGRVSAQVNDPFEKMRTALKLIRQAMEKLRTVVLENAFASDAEEIHFFKTIKPAFYKWRIYHAELYQIELNVPIGDAESQQVYFESELKAIERFLMLHPFQYQYYRMHLNELDRYYFLRKGENPEHMLPDLPEPEPQFSTPGDYLFSKLRAYDLLKDWLAERIVFLRKNPMVSYSLMEGSTELRWTGDKVKLAELGYALQLSGELNNGQAGINQIFRWLEEHLSVTIGVPAKRFSEIKSRKRLSRTQFMDELKDGLIRKMDGEDGKV